MTLNDNELLLQLSRFSCYYSPSHILVKDVDLSVRKGTILGISGVSGEGKSTLLRCLAGYHPLGAPVQKGSLDRKALKKQDISLLFQHADSHLNPIRKIGDQLLDLPIDHSKSEWVQLLECYGLQPGGDFFEKYPYMNSGGQNQRIGWMIGLENNPKLVLADEPVSNLDEDLKTFFADTLKKYIEQNDAGAVVVSHDMAWLRQLTDELFLLEKGKLKPYEKFQIDDIQPFRQQTEKESSILRISRLTYRYPGQKSDLIHELSLNIPSETIIGLFGASGAGKSTLLKIISGDILVPGALQWGRIQTKRNRHVVLIGQDATEEFHPLFTIKAQLEEYARKNSIDESHWLMWSEHFGIGSDLMSRKPAALSGGQLQRCAIIKALLSRPSLLLMDESFSGLDDAQFYNIMEQLSHLMREEEFSVFLVMHRKDLLKSVTRHCYELKDGDLREVSF